MIKTADLDKKFEDGIAELAEGGFIACLEVDEWMKPAELAEGAFITFPAPGGVALTGEGTAVWVGVPVPNPLWHWWCFWRPRVVLMRMPYGSQPDL